MDNKQFYSGIIVGLGIGFIMLAMGIYSVEEMVVIVYKEQLSEMLQGGLFEKTFASVLGTVTTALYFFIIGIIVSIAGLILHHLVRPTRQGS